jgi:hypothetical protein
VDGGSNESKNEVGVPRDPWCPPAPVTTPSPIGPRGSPGGALTRNGSRKQSHASAAFPPSTAQRLQGTREGLLTTPGRKRFGVGSTGCLGQFEGPDGQIAQRGEVLRRVAVSYPALVLLNETSRRYGFRSRSRTNARGWPRRERPG